MIGRAGYARPAPPSVRGTSSSWVSFGAQTLGHELQDGGHLLARHVELLHDLVDAEILDILDYSGYRSRMDCVLHAG